MCGLSLAAQHLLCQEDEPTCPSKFEFDFDFEGKPNLEISDWKDLMMREMLHFHPELA